jgi:hypothetical protein
MRRKRKPKVLTVVGRRWFRRSMGNTYSSVVVTIDGQEAYASEAESGYGNYFEQMAAEWMQANGYPTVGYSLSRWARENNVIFQSLAIDVARERDL